MGSRVLGSKVKLKYEYNDNQDHDIINPLYLHIPDKLLWLGQPARVRHQLGVVLLLGDEEVPLLVLFRDGAVIVSFPDNIIMSWRLCQVS